MKKRYCIHCLKDILKGRGEGKVQEVKDLKVGAWRCPAHGNLQKAYTTTAKNLRALTKAAKCLLAVTE